MCLCRALHRPLPEPPSLDRSLPAALERPRAFRTRFFVDDQPVHTIDQGLNYPLQLMIDLFEFPTDDHRDPRDYPKSALVRSVRGYRHR